MDAPTKPQKQFVKLGFTKEETKEVVDSLNILLANLSVFYQKLRNFHWNVRGGDFFDLHEKFEELYGFTATGIDQVAERIRIFGHTPLSSLHDYLETAQVEEAGTDLSSDEMVHQVIEDFEVIESFLIDVFDIASEVGDVGTTDMLNKIIARYEKEHWMLSAFSSK
ncbi:MAG TPA: DNA starvation/stationary phase protection protein [Bacteroidales bacterium]|nr:DNA starvation/stationary phase protection protein [Bacteroidales bacterium]